MENPTSYPLVFAAKNRDDAIRESSSSGGMFHAAASSVISRGGVVYGCAFDDSLRAVHIRCTNMDGVARCMGSKYSQSDLSGVFHRVCDDVKSGTLVLFTGTPCQVAAVRHATNNQENLVTIDIICHGVPSPELFQLYLEFLAKERAKRVQLYAHRPKDAGWGHQEKAVFSDGAEETGTRLIETWKRLFYANNMLRPSCYNCPYARSERDSDLTIADYWGIEHTDARAMKDGLGVSLVLVNSDKGKDLFERMDVQSMPSTLEEAVPRNPILLGPSQPRGERSRVWEDLYQNGFDKMVRSQTYYESALHRRLRLIKKRLIGGRR